MFNGAKQDSEYLEGVKQVDEPVESVKNGDSFPEAARPNGEVKMPC